MHRDPLLQLLTDYRLKYPDESDVVDQLAGFVRLNADCFRRELRIGHITGSAWLLDSTGTQTLLTHHRKLNRWLQLGGHADGETNVLDVALREAREESGIDSIRPLDQAIFDIDIHLIPERGDEPAHNHYDCRFLLLAEHEDYCVSEESNDLAWIPLDQVDGYTTEESVTRMVRKTPTL